MNKNIETMFLVEDEENHDIRISNSSDLIHSMSQKGMDYIELILEGQTKFTFNMISFKVCWLTELKPINKPFVGIFKAGNV